MAFAVSPHIEMMSPMLPKEKEAIEMRGHAGR